MITVGYLKKQLLDVPDDAFIYAYEGEIRGFVICSAKDSIDIAMIIHADESQELQEDQEPDIYGES